MVEPKFGNGWILVAVIVTVILVIYALLKWSRYYFMTIIGHQKCSECKRFGCKSQTSKKIKSRILGFSIDEIIDKGNQIKAK